MDRLDLTGLIMCSPELSGVGADIHQITRYFRMWVPSFFSSNLFSTNVGLDPRVGSVFSVPGLLDPRVDSDFSVGLRARIGWDTVFIEHLLLVGVKLNWIEKVKILLNSLDLYILFWCVSGNVFLLSFLVITWVTETRQSRRRVRTASVFVHFSSRVTIKTSATGTT